VPEFAVAMIFGQSKIKSQQKCKREQDAGMGILIFAIVGVAVFFAAFKYIKYVVAEQLESDIKFNHRVSEYMSRLGLDRSVEENYIKRVSRIPIGMRSAILTALSDFERGKENSSNSQCLSSFDNILTAAETSGNPFVEQNIASSESRMAKLKMEKPRRLAFDPTPGFTRIALAAFSGILFIVSLILIISAASLYSPSVMMPIFISLIFSALSCFILGVLFLALGGVLKNLDESRYLLSLICAKVATSDEKG
jgi:hypothetical protein